MPLPAMVKAMVEKKVGEFCEKRVPKHVRHEVTVSYKIRGSGVIIYENRAPWSKLAGDKWTSMEIAQLRYDEKSGKWTLYCYTRRGRQDYWDLEPNKRIEVLLREIDKDPTGIFWG